MIELKIGRLFNNKTGNYLSPILNSFDKNFTSFFYGVKNHIRCFAIGDIKYEKVKKIGEQYLLFVILDKLGPYDVKKEMYISSDIGIKNFNNFLYYARTTEYYFDDYAFNPNSLNEHCLVLRLPEKWHSSYKYFLNSAYSKMYSLEDLKECKISPLLRNGKNNFVYQVLTKDPNYRDIFFKKLNEHFGSNVVFDLEDDREFELPIKKENEILNYEKNKSSKETDSTV